LKEGKKKKKIGWLVASAACIPWKKRPMDKERDRRLSCPSFLPSACVLLYQEWYKNYYNRIL